LYVITAGLYFDLCPITLVILLQGKNQDVQNVEDTLPSLSLPY